MDKVAESAGFGLLEYGIAGIFILFLIALFYYTTKNTATERAISEARDTARETSLRATVAKAFDERHDDSVKIFSKISRMEAKMNIKDNPDA